MTHPSASSAATDVRLYLYDSSNGWCAQGRTASGSFRLSAGNAPDAVEAAWALATNVMALQAQGRTLPPASGLQLPSDASAVWMQYLASTLTFEHVCKAYGDPSGHWLVVMYRFDDKEPILRPAFLMHPAQTLSRQEVASWVAQTVEHDRNATASEVHRLVFKGEGPTLSPLLR